MKVLIVDDMSGDRYLLRQIAERHGHEVLEAANGEEGLAIAAAQRPDLIISDALMPVMDGFQFLRGVKSDAALKATPFIFYSATYQENNDLELARALGADAYIIKPQEPLDLWEEVEKTLRERPQGSPAAPPPVAAEEEYLKRYSEVVTRKLEKKVRELESEITSRKAAEERLRESDAFARGILESVGEGIVVINAEYRIISANKAFCGQTKLICEEIVGRHCYEASHQSDKPCFLQGEDCAPKHTFEDGMPHIAIHTHFDKTGNPISIETQSFPMKDAAGKVFAVIETLNDITEKRSLESQLRHAQKMEAIGTLAGGIAHDFNNLLNVMLGYGGLMQLRMKADDPLLPQLQEILAAGDRAAQLTKGLLTFCRKQVMEVKTVNVNEIVAGFQKMLRRIIGEDIELKIALAPAAAPTAAGREPEYGDLVVKADVIQIEQVLMNLAVNARDAMSAGGTFTIATGPFRMDQEFVRAQGYGAPGLYALLTVSDTGSGMDEATKARIFEPYFTTKALGRGTGLGLSIIYGIVAQHLGYIACQSEPGVGTTFRIYLPLLTSEVGSVEKETVSPPGGGTETILLAEDDPNVRGLMKEALESFGYTVFEAVDGEDAVRTFREHRDAIRLLLFDIIMPVKNGMAAYNEIKVLSPGVKALFMSGYDRDVMQRFGIAEEIEFVTKPIALSQLLRKVRETLDTGGTVPA